MTYHESGGKNAMNQPKPWLDPNYSVLKGKKEGTETQPETPKTVNETAQAVRDQHLEAMSLFKNDQLTHDFIKSLIRHAHAAAKETSGTDKKEMESLAENWERMEKDLFPGKGKKR